MELTNAEIDYDEKQFRGPVNSMKSILTSLILLAAAWPAAAQVWDNTGNGLLNGSYYFREVSLTSSAAYAAYGNITFTNGTYSTNAVIIESSQSGEGEDNYTPSGTYSIAASGFGFINNSSGSILSSPIYGLVGANGVFIGSATESGANDIFIAAPVTSQSTGTLQGSYSLSYLSDPTSGSPFGALLQMSANGGGGIGNVGVTAYQTSSSPSTQTISGVNYFVSNNAFVVTFPNSNNNLIAGQEYVYSTPDGSFVFGGSPGAFDMLVGVRNGSSGSSFGGLYYTAGFQTVYTSTSYYLSSSYGSFNTSNGAILGHQRTQDGSGAYGFTFADSYPANSGGSYTDSFLNTQFIGGNGGATQVGVGIGPNPGISVALQAPSLNGSTSVYLSPVGVENSASYAPFTAGISRGEYITLAGTNLGPGTLQVESAVPFPTMLGNVQVLINNIPAPIYYVSSNQVAVIVPNETNSSIAQIQVVNNGVPSNAVTVFVNETTPGVFSQQQDGIGYGAVIHKNGELVTPDNPAQIGETVSAYLAGLGDVFPALLNGVAAPSSPLSDTSNAITVDVNGTAATAGFEGLAPGFVGLYQVNVVIPSGVTAGDNFLDFSGPDSYNVESLISVGSSAAVPGPAVHSRPRPQTTTRPHPFAKGPAHYLSLE